MPRFRWLPTRKIVNPFPMMVRNERNQPSIQNQVSMLTVRGSSFSQGQEEGGGGGGSLEIFGWQCAAGTLEHVAYTSVSAEFCYPIKLNFPNPSLSKDCSLISIPNPILTWELYPIKLHNISHLTVPPAGARLPFSLSFFITNFKRICRNIFSFVSVGRIRL